MQRQEARQARGDRHILEQFDYDGKDEEVVGKPDRKIIGPSALLSEQTSVQSFTRL